MDNWKCFYCNKELKEKEECNCEKSKDKKGYITTNASTQDNKLVCECECKEFTNIAHMDFAKFFSNTYRCSKCNNIIGVQFEREDDSYWNIED